MEKFVSVYKAKTELSSLIDQVLEGDEVVITRHGKPTVRIVIEERPPLRPGLLREMYPDAVFSDVDFDASTPEMDAQWELWRENIQKLGTDAI